MNSSKIHVISNNTNGLQSTKNLLKLAFAIFYFFTKSKKLFSFMRFSDFCNFLPSFPHFPDSKGQMKVV